MEITSGAIILRLVLTLVLGAAIGIQREKAQTPAGLRTHMLVTLGSGVFTLVSFMVTDPSGLVDITRISAGIVTGIGFLGAGTILRHKDHIRGLSTAASVWTAAAIGMAVGYGLYLIACVATLLTLVVLFMDGIEKKFFK